MDDIFDIKPWNLEATKLFERMCRDGKAHTNNHNLTRQLGIHCKDLIDFEVLDIARTNNRKKNNRTYILPTPNFQIMKLNTGKGLKFRFKPLKL